MTTTTRYRSTVDEKSVLGYICDPDGKTLQSMESLQTLLSEDDSYKEGVTTHLLQKDPW